MSSDVIACSETNCSSTDTFLCVKHCQRYVCFDHLQEHHRVYELEKNDFPKELRRQIQQRIHLYNRLIDHTKLNEQEKRDIEIACTEIRRTYEQRRRDHQQLQTEGTSILDQQSTIKDLKIYLDKLDVAIEREQQRERVYSNSELPVNIKLEPNEFMEHHENNHVIPNSLSNSTSLSMENKDEKSDESSAEEGEEQSDANMSDIGDGDSDYDDRRPRKSSTNHSVSNINQSVTIYRGPCPVTRNGVYGILPIHNIRVCEGKSSCLYNHLQSFHHMTARSAYKVCRAALKQRDPMATILFESSDVLYNKYFHIACPFNEDSRNPFECQPKMIAKSPCNSVISRLDMPRHLRDVHHVHRAYALKIVAELRRCAKNSDKSNPAKLNRNLFDKHENIIEVNNGKINSQTGKPIRRRK